MSPRPRKRGNKDLPTNLHSSSKNGKNYYQYRHPVSKKYIGFGTNKVEAIKAAKQLNQIIIGPSDLVAKVIHAKNPFKEFLEYYRDTVIPTKRINGHKLSDITINENNRMIKHIIKELGHLDITAVTQSHIAGYLNQQTTAETHNKHRAQLVMIFKKAISDGCITENLPERILKRDKELVKRTRLTLEQYKLIFQHAPRHIQLAMELSLNSIQRRKDIQQWRFDSEKDDYFYIIQSKTHKHGKAAYIRIPTKLPVAYSEGGYKTLRDIVRDCRDENVCPFVIHKQPERRRSSAEKEHMMQLSGKEISDGFTKARIAAGINIENPPTFHELLSLGESLRIKQGWSMKDIQTLRGHTKEETTRGYLDGQEWTTVDLPT